MADTTQDLGADYGEVFTRRWVVEMILDLIGYRPHEDLGSRVLVEPACGTGAFLIPVVDRLVESAVRHGRSLATLTSAVQAFEVLGPNAERARKAVATRLAAAGLGEHGAQALAAQWVTTGDFLLIDHQRASADYVVGNPPYIRLEHVRRPVMDAYRRACPTMRGRSDIYVGFIERGLGVLRPGGLLGYICADRWMHNQYGAALRELIAASYAVETVVSMHDVDAFEDGVSAYPAVVVLRNARQGDAAVVETKGGFSAGDARHVGEWVREGIEPVEQRATYEASRLDHWFPGGQLWPSGRPAELALLAELEARWPTLEDPRTATRVGIGVATGCDEVFITANASLVEEERLLPLLQAGDVATGSVRWSGAYLVNPWDEHALVDLADFPRLGEYLRAHEVRLRGRHVGTRRPAQWYRTIDRVDTRLLASTRLVLPDMKASAHPVLDDGFHYPHHNLYHVISRRWDPEVLGGLLLSDVANLFVGAYCVKMRGGCYRFQAQYLRKIRVPDPGSINHRTSKALARAFLGRDREQATAAAAKAYQIDISQLR
ncbi:MAG: Eco57I restriction-modification methylase domain-containing protein [Acidimicrobiales bacterium]